MSKNKAKNLLVPKNQSLKIASDYHGAMTKIDDSPWPGFPADLTSIALVVATQCSGTVLIFEKMFESRLFFVDYLINMGAKIVLCDPHRAVVIGPSDLLAPTHVQPRYPRRRRTPHRRTLCQRAKHYPKCRPNRSRI